MSRLESVATILIVDDSAVDRELAVRAISRSDLRLACQQASSIAELNQILKGEPMHLVLTDYDLGSADGFEVLNLVRASWPDTPVMFFTGSGSEDIAISALRHGAADYVLKTPGFDELLPLRVRSVLEQAEVRRSRIRLTQWVEATPDFVTWCDVFGHIMYLNEGGALLTGVRPEDAVGKPFEGFYPAENGGDLRARFAAIIEGQDKWSGESSVIAASGERIPVAQTIIAHRDRTGRVSHVSMVARDLRSVRAAEAALAESNTRLEDVLEGAGLGTWTFDLVAGTVTWDEQMAQLMGRTLEDAPRDYVGVMALVSPQDRRDLEAMMRRSTELGREFDTEFCVPLADGSIRTLATRGRTAVDDSGRPTQMTGVCWDVTGLHEATVWRKAVLEALPARIALVAHDGRILQVNERWSAYAGEDACLQCGAGANYLEVCDQARALGDHDAGAVADKLRDLLAGKIEQFEHEYPCSEPDRPDAWYRMIASRSSTQQVDGAVVAHFDETERKRIEGELSIASRAFSQMVEVILVLDSEFTVLKANEAITAMTGYTADQLVGTHLALFGADLNGADIEVRIRERLERSGTWSGELWGRRQSGESFPMLVGFNALRDDAGAVSQIVAVVSDLTAHHEVERRLDHLVHHDALTGLPNRLTLQKRMSEAVARAQRSGGLAALLLFDLDGFKGVNNSLGLSAGDRVLRVVGERMNEALRSGDLLARLGGDDFAVLAEDLRSAEDARTIATKMLAVLDQPIEVEGERIVLSANVGIALTPSDGMDAETLLRNADTALYEAKELGTGSTVYFAAEMNAQAREDLILRIGLRKAIDEDELFVVYQPIVALPEGQIIGFEALVRWQHPELGVVSPVRFIRIAEDTGLIIPLGEFVLRRAVEQAASWHANGFEGYISVNLSMRQFRGPDIGETIAATLAAAGLPASQLCLELTESILSADPVFARTVLDGLHKKGIRVAIDDFGTGYSSLSYLKSFPLDLLKIDQSFVRDAPEDAEDVAIVRAVIALAHSLGLKVIAEGVETDAQWDLLAAEGCDAAQGYRFSMPMAAKDADWLLKNHMNLPVGGRKS